MEIDFDPVKDAANRRKHGLGLADGGAIFDDPDALILPSFREIDGEPRYKVIGRMKGRLHTAVFVRRGDSVRFISVRRSNGNERRCYEDSPSG